MKTRKLLFTLLATFALAATSAFAGVTGAQTWEESCAQCHGADGKGNTKVGKKLSIRDYTDAKVQAGFKEADMVKAITAGVKNEAGKEVMKGFREELADAEVAEVVKHIRTFAPSGALDAVKQAEPAKVDEAAKPTKAVEVAEPIKADESIKPAEAPKSIEPAKVDEVAKPAEVVKPTEPAKADESAKPAAPAPVPVEDKSEPKPETVKPDEPRA